MITKEQAEKVFHDRYDNPDWPSKPEIRNLQIEEITERQADNICIEDNLGFEIQDQGWKFTFEIRYRQLDQGKWTGQYHEWRKYINYVVEPKPGAYLIE